MAKRRGDKPEMSAEVSSPADQPEVAKPTAAEPEQSTGGTPKAPQAAPVPAPEVLPRFSGKRIVGQAKELPVVEAPSLDPSAATPASAIRPDVAEPELNFGFQPSGSISANPKPPGASEGTAAATPRTSRFALLAASLAVAAALGAAAGSLSTSGFVHVRTGAAIAGDPRQAQLAELAALKSELDAATRNASSQLAKIADRLDRVERAEQEPTSKLTHIADAVDRLEKRVTTAPEVTGSIGAAPSAEPKPAVLPDWIVQDVQGGHALIQNRNGGLFDISAGSVLPGIGRVDAVRRQDGQWVVVTAHGLITTTGR